MVGDNVDGVVTVTLNRPEKKNALSIALRDEVSDAFDALAADDAVRVVVITGAGSVFSAGLRPRPSSPIPIPSTSGVCGTRAIASITRCCDSRCRSWRLSTAPALAGGFDLAVLCDLRVAADIAYFAHVEHTFGDVVYRPLRDLVGGSVARDLVLTGRRIDAGEALAVGLVNRVVPAADLLGAALAVAADIALAPRDVLIRTKAKIIAAADIGPTLRTLDL